MKRTLSHPIGPNNLQIHELTYAATPWKGIVKPVADPPGRANPFKSLRTFFRAGGIGSTNAVLVWLSDYNNHDQCSMIGRIQVKQPAIVAVMLLLVVPAYAQSNRLSERFDVAVRTSVPGAKVEVIPEGTPGADGYQRWRYDGGRVTARHYIHRTAEEAKQNLEGLMRTIPVKTRKVEDVGDDAFLVASMMKGEQYLSFRHGRVVVTVTAPDEENVRKLALLLLAEVHRGIRGGERL